MTIRHPLARAALLAAALFAATAAQAAVTVYTSQSAFVGAVGTVGVDSFDNLTVAPGPLSYSRSAGSFAYTASVIDDKGVADSFYPGGAGSDIWLSTNTGVDRIVFSGFGSDVRGIGGIFFGGNSDGGFFANQPILVTLTDIAGSTSRTVLSSSAASPSFLGFVSTNSLVSMTVQTGVGASESAWPSVNNLTLAAAVPEPASYALMTAGIVALLLMRRRSR